MLAIAGTTFQKSGLLVFDKETSAVVQLPINNSIQAEFSPDGKYLLSVWQSMIRVFGEFAP